MGMFDVFKKKKQTDFPAFDIPTDYQPDYTPEVTHLTEESEPVGITKLDDSFLRERPVEKTRVSSSSLENLCQKIDVEAENIERQFQSLRSKVKELNLKSPEIIDLLNLYQKTNQSVDNFVREIDRFDFTGWGADDNTAALYKFRACKSLATMRRKAREIEKLSKQAGLTPSKVQQILTTPAEKLVEELV